MAQENTALVRADENNSILAHRPGPVEEWQVLKEKALFIAKSQFYSDLNGMEKAATIMMQGAELGLQPMAAVRNIHVIKGKPTLSAQLMAALVIKAGHPRIKILSHTETECKVSARRRDETDWQEYTFTMADASKAGLVARDGSLWNKYPKNMLYSRAISNICKMVFPDIFAGMYTPEEMKDGVGEVDPNEPDIAVIDIKTGERLTVVEPAPNQLPQETERSRYDVANGPLSDKGFANQLSKLGNFPANDREKLGQAATEVAAMFGHEKLGDLITEIKAKDGPDAGDPYRAVLRDYVEARGEQDKFFNWKWLDLAGLPVAAEDLPF
jgi:hypothetical protein